MFCKMLHELESDFCRSQWDTPQKYARLFAVKDHQREGHDGEPCPDSENPLAKENREHLLR